VLTPVEVESRLLDLCDLLAAQTEEARTLAIQAAELESRWRLNRARQALKIRAAAEQRLTEGAVEAMVTDATAEDYHRMRLAQAEADAARDAMFSTRARLDALRTIAASMREQFKG